MKQIINNKTILQLIVLIAIYLFAAFYEVKIDFRVWHEGTRFVVTIFAAFAMFIISINDY